MLTITPPVRVRNDIDVNEHERLSNITLRHKLNMFKYRNSTFIETEHHGLLNQCSNPLQMHKQLELDRGFIGGVMVSILSSSVVDRGFIGGVMVSILSSSAVDRGFIGGVMVSILSSSAVDRGFIGGVMVMNPRSTTLEERMLTITPPMNPRSTALEK
jgi:hypothetical protein